MTTTRRCGRRAPERGSASVLVVGVMGVVVTLATAAMLVAGYLVAQHRARAAADLAALSGAVAYAQGEDACAAAGRAASRNGARLISCEQVGDLVDFVVSVDVRVHVAPRLRGLPSAVPGRAHAGPVG